MWRMEKGRKTFLYGKNNDAMARIAAEKCPDYIEDSEIECVSDDEKSCYNCRYRRWTQESFQCMKGERK